MPVRVSYPGVYIEELPSGVRTLVGVATSIAAFLGRAAAGPVDQPVEVNGIGEFERELGSISPAYPMSLAVRDFFQNGGSRAIVVRRFLGSGGRAELTVGGLTLEARSPGKWGEALRAEVTGVTDSDDQFDLEIRDTRPGGAVERHLNLTVADEVRRVDRVLEAQSRLVHWKRDWPASAPSVGNGTDPVTPLEEDLGKKEKTLVQTKGTLEEKNAALRQAIRAGSELEPFKEAVQEADKGVKKAETEVEKAKKALDDKVGKMKAADSEPLSLTDKTDFLGSRAEKTGLYALEKVDLFNLLCIPPDTHDGSTPNEVYQTALEYCVERRALLIVDSRHDWDDVDAALTGLPALGLTGPAARNAALYFPRVVQSDPEVKGGSLTLVPCGLVAGIMANTDTQRGVWKAPAGVDASLSGVQGLQVKLTDHANGRLNDMGINCLRTFPVTGNVVWGARTLRGANQHGDEYKYVPVRRLALFLEESLYRGTQWVVFEPNDEPLWAQIRLNVGAFLQNLFRQGAFQGRSPREAYFVKCDKDTTTQNDIDLGVVNIVVGFAPLKPAEFVIIKFQQMAGQIET